MQDLKTETNLARFLAAGVESLESQDPELHGILLDEYQRQNEVLTMVASSSIAQPAALVCESMPTMNVTAEGYPGARFHAGCRNIDRIEQLAIDRANALFGSRFANVQPMSATSANEVVFFSVLKPGDTLLGMDLDSGGHLTHGSKASISGQVFDAIGYGLTKDERLDYDEAHRLALEHKPKLIICGTTAYSREVDFPRFREIADEVGAYLLADITHIAGLVAAGIHPSPVDHAHFTTMCTHKQMFGGRGGLILIGKDYDQPAPNSKFTLAQIVQKKVFPFFQGAPNQSAIASKARGLAFCASDEFKAIAKTIVELAQALADAFTEKGYRVITGGTDNHIVVVDVMAKGITGVVAEKALEDCGIVVNKNRIPYDVKPPSITSGIRLGTNGLPIRRMTPDDMRECVDLVHEILTTVEATGDREYTLPPDRQRDFTDRVKEICRRRPISTYPQPAE